MKIMFKHMFVIMDFCKSIMPDFLSQCNAKWQYLAFCDELMID